MNEKINEEAKAEATKNKYLLIDKKFNKPYLDENRRSYLFVDELKAKKKRAELEDVKIIDVTNRGLRDIFSICYASGATHLYIVGDNPAEDNDEKIEKENLVRRYYNNKLNGCLRLQVQYKSLEAKEELANCVYIVAVNIDKTREEYMVYANVKNSKGFNALVAFSDLAEFEQWKNKYGQKYKPLEVDFLGLQRLGGRHGFLINPLTSKFYLSPELIDDIRKSLFDKIEMRKKILAENSKKE
jgi:hypothetical protein